MLNDTQILKLNWDKTNGMLPVIIQSYYSNKILMHGYMNKPAFFQTRKEGMVTFYSRTKKRLWKKGETSGNYLKVVNITTDCDYDTLLILVIAIGKTCHLDSDSCFFLSYEHSTFLFELETIIAEKINMKNNLSYTYNLYNSGTARIAQKVGEEAVETILSVFKEDKKELINECS